MPLPILQGVRILDFTHFLAGPAVTRLLAELGAEVIKVESIQRYDGSRSMYEAPESDAYERSATYNYFNTNKLGVTLNLQDPRGVAVAKQLVMVSDAVVDNFPTGTMARLGLDEAALRSLNPSLVIMSMAGYGQRGPWSNHPTFATSLAMMAGLYELTGYPGGEPATPSVAGVDPMNGIIGANTLLMALMYRRRMGRGLRLDYAQLEATTTLVGEVVADCSVNGRVATRRGNRHPVAAPHGIYPCREEDTWVSIAVSGDDQFRRLCELMGRPTMAQDPRFSDCLARHRNVEDLDDVVAGWTRLQEQYQAVRLLQDQDIAAGVVHSSKSVWEDPHLKWRGAFEEIVHPVVGKKPYPRPALRLAGVERSVSRPAPTLGQDNDLVLGTLLAIPPQEVATLDREGVIGTQPLTTRV